MQTYQLFIDGCWQDASSIEYFDSINPYTNKAWAKIPRGNAEDIQLACEAAHRAFPAWAARHSSQRGHLLRKLGDLIAEKAEYLARIEVQDNGKLLSEMTQQLRYIPEHFYYFAGMADKILGSVIPVDKPDHFAYTLLEPLGVIAAIIPWNSPLLITAWKLAPALAAGNTIVLKPSEYTSASAFEFAKLVEEAGFPKGVVNVVSGFGPEVGAPLVEHPYVTKVSLTGGTQTGINIYQQAAKNMKKVALELGGKSPNIIFSDANIDNAVNGAISGIFAASGQTCIAGSRLLVQEGIHDEVVEKLVAIAKTAMLGDPMQANTQVGPVTMPGQHAKILEYMDIATADGATCVLGGKAASGGSCGDSPWFVEPSIYTGVTNDMRIAQEEVFGPILSIIKFKDEDEAVAIANDIDFGLAAGVWTQDIGKAMRMPKRLQAGTIWVNTYRTFSYMVPFGGYKQSGIGKESGPSAIYEYLQEKSVWLNLQESTPNPFVMK